MSQLNKNDHVQKFADEFLERVKAILADLNTPEVREFTYVVPSKHLPGKTQLDIRLNDKTTLLLWLWESP